MTNIPEDPIILLSWINTKLRDEYNSLKELCSSEGMDVEYIERKLADAGFEYLPDINQFR